MPLTGITGSPSMSLGHRTDLVVLRLTGSDITEHGPLTLVRTPSNPTYRWGNFVLVDDSDDGADWFEALGLFRSAFPGETTVRFGIAPSPPMIVLPGYIARLDLEGDVALVSDAAPSAPVPDGMTVRALEDDGDWAAAFELQRVNNGYEDDADVDFLTQQLAAYRGAVERGSGRWFGAFVGEALVGGLGVFSDGGPDARYQSVDTHPDWRRRGVASAMLAAAGRWALDALGAQRLVIVAERDSAAMRLYERLGFSEVDVQLRLSGPQSVLGL
ncbi:Ribosomal protein S18 acetylase RimI [Quadrisphaera granulorum]|uniref:Ribosomal protein S18 acetylase RimI-like enzyme n=1 Tax=Quadrisphaera granulorum TaxID=317664 RepID=A0A315ZZQ1_9ACTN|nr:GNAT family N-acetyltransferase [Quadrisphaera granulorum]PWJ51136.1 ribosomal protein S18 acetylase RimI-like enzyme [Quadrisphaera granulorum]SZE97786.1 Ribosomal protein S18 acetylase RimI [Quadrisphaera granulorum]